MPAQKKTSFSIVLFVLSALLLLAALLRSFSPLSQAQEGSSSHTESISIATSVSTENYADQQAALAQALQIVKTPSPGGWHLTGLPTEVRGKLMPRGEAYWRLPQDDSTFNNVPSGAEATWLFVFRGDIRNAISVPAIGSTPQRTDESVEKNVQIIILFDAQTGGFLSSRVRTEQRAIRMDDIPLFPVPIDSVLTPIVDQPSPQPFIPLPTAPGSMEPYPVPITRP